MRIKATFDNGESITVDLPDTHTLTLRGGGKHEFKREGYHAEGLRKIVTYGEGRYLRDGAPAVAHPKRPADDKTLRGVDGAVWDKDVERWDVSVAGIAALVKAGSATLAKLCNDSLNTQAVAHAVARTEALHTGKIAEGKVSSVPPEVNILRPIVTRAYVKATGCKVSDVPRIPSTVEGMRSTFLAIPGLSPPKGQGNTGKWFDAILAHAIAEAKRRDDAGSDLGI